MRISMCSPPYGGIAQLGERLNGIQEVSGSIPLISTKTTNRKAKNLAVLLCSENGYNPNT